MLAKKIGETQVDFTRLRCKQWACEYCSKKNAQIWRAYLLHELNHNENLVTLQWSFITITFEKWIHEVEGFENRVSISIDEYRKKWNNFITRMKQNYGKFEYVRVIEMHKDGVLHIHMLASVQFDDLVVTKKSGTYSKRLKALLKDCGFGYISNIENLSSWNCGRVVGYVTKYMTKESLEFHQAVNGKRVRRIQTSRNIGSPKTESESGDQWQVVRKITYDDYVRLRGQDKKLYDLNRKEFVDADHFYDENEEFIGTIE